MNPIDPSRRSFGLALSKAKREEWVLVCTRFRAPVGEEPTIVELPADPEADLREHLLPTLVDGQWSIRLERRPDVPKEIAQKAKYRLRKWGKLSTAVTIKGSPATSTPPVQHARTVRAAPATPTVPETISTRAARDDLEQKKIELERLRLEIEERKLKRELAAHSQEKPPVAQVTPWPAIVAACAPIVERLLTSAQQRDAMILRLLAERAEVPEPPPPPPPASSSIRETIGTMRELIGAVSELNLGGGETSLPATIAQLVQSLAPVLTTAPPARLPAVGSERPQQQQRGDPVKLRVAQWLMSVHQAANNDLDPEAVADELEHPFGLLPGKMRTLVLQAPSLEAILTGLVEWVPEHFLRPLQAALATNAAVRSWLERFVNAVRTPGEDDDDDEHGEGNGLAPGALAATLAGSPADDSDEAS